MALALQLLGAVYENNGVVIPVVKSNDIRDISFVPEEIINLLFSKSLVSQYLQKSVCFGKKFQ